MPRTKADAMDERRKDKGKKSEKRSKSKDSTSTSRTPKSKSSKSKSSNKSHGKTPKTSSGSLLQRTPASSSRKTRAQLPSNTTSARTPGKTIRTLPGSASKSVRKGKETESAKKNKRKADTLKQGTHTVSEKTPAKKRRTNNGATAVPDAEKAPTKVVPQGKSGKLRISSIRHVVGIMKNSLPGVLEKTATIRRPGVKTVLQRFIKDAEHDLSKPMKGIGTRAASSLSKVATSNQQLENSLLLDAHHVRILESELKVAYERLDIAKERLRTFRSNLSSNTAYHKRIEASRLHKMLGKENSGDGSLVLPGREVEQGDGVVAGADYDQSIYDAEQDEDVSSVKQSLVRQLAKIRENGLVAHQTTAKLFRAKEHLDRVLTTLQAKEGSSSSGSGKGSGDKGKGRPRRRRGDNGDGGDDDNDGLDVTGQASGNWTARRASRRLTEQTSA